MVSETRGSVTPSKDRKRRTVDWRAEGEGMSVPANGQQLGSFLDLAPHFPLSHDIEMALPSLVYATG